MYDACANGQKIKYLTVVDEYTLECLAIDMSGASRSSRVIDVLSRLMRIHSVPRYLHFNNRPEFISKALLEWAIKEALQLVLIDPGKHWQNGANERFNGKFRDECLSMGWPYSRLQKW